MKILLLLLLMPCFCWGQIPDFFGAKYPKEDSISRFCKVGKDSFEVTYKYNNHNYYETMVGYMVLDSTGKIDQEAIDKYYLEDRHYWAVVTVYKLVGKEFKRELFFSGIDGLYVPHQCFEDFPEGYVNEAIKRKTPKK